MRWGESDNSPPLTISKLVSNGGGATSGNVMMVREIAFPTSQSG